MEETSLQHKYVPLKVVFVHRKTRRKFSGLVVVKKVKFKKICIGYVNIIELFVLAYLREI